MKKHWKILRVKKTTVYIKYATEELIFQWKVPPKLDILQKNHGCVTNSFSIFLKAFLRVNKAVSNVIKSGVYEPFLHFESNSILEFIEFANIYREHQKYLLNSFTGLTIFNHFIDFFNSKYNSHYALSETHNIFSTKTSHSSTWILNGKNVLRNHVCSGNISCWISITLDFCLNEKKDKYQKQFAWIFPCYNNCLLPNRNSKMPKSLLKTQICAASIQ